MAAAWEMLGNAVKSFWISGRQPELQKMKVAVERLRQQRQRQALPCFCLCLCLCLALLIPKEVTQVVRYFTPLLLSTALCVVSLLRLFSPCRSHDSQEEKKEEAQLYEKACKQKQDLLLLDHRFHFAATKEEDEDDEEDKEEVCFIECVKQLHQSGGELFESVLNVDLLRQCSCITDMLMLLAADPAPAPAPDFSPTTKAS